MLVKTKRKRGNSMAYNYLGDLYKSDVVAELQQKGFDVKDVHALNVILEEMGLVVHSGNLWITTDEGVPYTIYRSHCNADAWHPSVVDAICDYLSYN